MDHQPLVEFFKNSQIKEVLNQNVDSCYICLLGEKEGKEFVLKIKKKEDANYSLNQWMENLSKISNSTMTFNNDIYSKYQIEGFLKSEVGNF